MSPHRWLALGLAIALFVGFVWAVKAFFRRDTDGDLRLGMQTIALGGALTIGLHVGALALAPEVSWGLGLAALQIYALALWVFWSAVWANRAQPLAIAFSEVEPEHLVTRGPYAYVRHPFYLAYSLAWFAGFAATGQLWLLATVMGMGALYLRAARMEEATFVAGPLGLDYAAYRQRTGMFLPR